MKSVSTVQFTILGKNVERSPYNQIMLLKEKQAKYKERETEGWEGGREGWTEGLTDRQAGR